MFGNKLEAANNQIVALLGMLALAGYKPASAEAATLDGFKASLEQHTKTASDTAVAAAVAPLNAGAVELTAFRAGLKAHGIEVKFGAEHKDDAARASVVQTAIQGVIDTKATTGATKQLNAASHSSALALDPAPAGSDPKSAAKPANVEEFKKGLAARDGAERTEYFRAHKAAFKGQL